MRSRIMLIFLAMVLVVSVGAFGACAAPVEEEEKAPLIEEKSPAVKEKAPVVKEKAPTVKEKEAPPVVEEEWQWPEKLTLLSQGAAVMGYAIEVAWTTPMAEDTGMKIRQVSQESAMLRHLWLKQDPTFFSTIWDFGTAMSLEAREQWATRDRGSWQVRSWWTSGRGGCGFAVRGDSDIKTPSDIKPGVKLIDFPVSPLWRDNYEALLAWAQVDPEDVEWLPAGSIDGMTRFLITGKGDICFGFPASPTWYEAEASPHGLKWIELDAEKNLEGAKRFMEVRSAYFGVLSLGVPSAIGVHGMVTLPSYITRADTDPELVYHMVKWMDENHDKYKDAHPYCKDMTVDTLMEVAEIEFVPLHDGAVKYLKEIGRWTEAHEARRQANIDLITRYEEAYQTAIDMADDEGIKIDPKNEKWLELWENYKKELGLPRFRLFMGLD